MPSLARCTLVFVIAIGLGCTKPKDEQLVDPEPIFATPEPAPVPEPSREPPQPIPEETATDAPDQHPEFTRAEIMEFAVYTPEPDAALLQNTKAARFDKSDGHSTVEFCVETNGTTSGIRTIENFPGDPMVDQIIRDTIAKWRFKPVLVDGVLIKVCTTRKYVLKFR